jgi:tetratricopeptide (TPR) repeat protein
MRFGVFRAVIMVFVAARAEAQSAPPAAPVGVAPPSLAPAAPVSPAPAPPSSQHPTRVLTDGSVSPAQAAEHFERALGWYRAGKYQRAVVELEAALERDPGGKDLVFNLALVQEKLGDLRGAIVSLRRFQNMEKDPKELERASQTIERLKGAQAELLLAARGAPASAAAAPAPSPAPRVRGKFDAWVIGTGGLALASLVVGTAFGIRSLTLDADESARDAAMIADVALVTSLLAGAGSVALYFGRFADAPERATALPLAQPLPHALLARIEFRY